MKKILLMLFVAAIIMVSCKKEESNIVDNTTTEDANNTNDDITSDEQLGSMKIAFNTIAGTEDFTFETDYINASGDTFSVNMFKYYVSNIVLKSVDGGEYKVPTTATSGYFLINEEAETEIQITGIPENDYTGIEFLLGVDSLRNTMDPEERLGDLDIGDANTAGGMYWSWNSGYIFSKFEGFSSSVPDSTVGAYVQDSTGAWMFDTTQYTYWNDAFNVHVGGYGGYSSKTPNNIRVVSLTTSEEALVRQTNTDLTVNINVDILKIMDGDENHSFVDFYSEHSPMRTGNIANNMQKMFTISLVNN